MAVTGGVGIHVADVQPVGGDIGDAVAAIPFQSGLHWLGFSSQRTHAPSTADTHECELPILCLLTHQKPLNHQAAQTLNLIGYFQFRTTAINKSQERL